MLGRLIALRRRFKYWLDLANNIPRLKGFFPEITDEDVRERQQLFRDIDSRMIGRYCGSTSDRLMHASACLAFAKRFPSQREYAHVEIGVLFGGSAISKLSLLKANGIDHTLVAIDPFAGYYGQTRDPESGDIVDEMNFLRNVERFGLNHERVEVVKCYSTDPEAREALKHFRIVTLMIDGDHSYEGAKKDWKIYAPMVEPGGCVIVDDYGNPDWPGVKKAMDEVLASNDGMWTRFGLLDTTLVLERRGR